MVFECVLNGTASVSEGVILSHLYFVRSLYFLSLSVYPRCGCDRMVFGHVSCGVLGASSLLKGTQ